MIDPSVCITPERLFEQEERFAAAFAERDFSRVRPLYHADVVYLSPTVRLFDWPRRIEGVAKTLEFIAVTIQACPAVRYEAVESACLPDGASSFVRIHFDWDQGGKRLRSNYVVLYRYRDDLIAQQEIYYDPSGALEELPPRPRPSASVGGGRD